jgi:hypothetical protein
MGLYIRTYINLKFISSDEEAIDNLRDEPGYAEIHVNPYFPGRADSLQDGIYSCAEVFEFRAGSYSWYGLFRRALAALGGMEDVESVWKHPKTHEDQPFFELVNFADNDGTLDRSTCSKLADDFAQYELEMRRRALELGQTTITAMISDGHWDMGENTPEMVAKDFTEMYKNFKAAFQQAAADEAGAVVFR